MYVFGSKKKPGRLKKKNKKEKRKKTKLFTPTPLGLLN
jgi:hypothetical protein